MVAAAAAADKGGIVWSKGATRAQKPLNASEMRVLGSLPPKPGRGVPPPVALPRRLGVPWQLQLCLLGSVLR